jgi:hypothetical protein
MGLLDHKRTWNYEVSASASDCIRAFDSAFTGRGGLVSKAKWKVQRDGTRGATATYQGRKGLGAVGGILSQTAAQEADTAIGSTVSFIAEPVSESRTRCSMHLSWSGRSGIPGILGVTSDARFIRPYMQAVTKEIQKLDPTADIFPS